MTASINARTSARLAIAIALCILLPLPALAETIYVDGECNFAQASSFSGCGRSKTLSTPPKRASAREASLEAQILLS